MTEYDKKIEELREEINRLNKEKMVNSLVYKINVGDVIRIETWKGKQDYYVVGKDVTDYFCSLRAFDKKGYLDYISDSTVISCVTIGHYKSLKKGINDFIEDESNGDN